MSWWFHASLEVNVTIAGWLKNEKRETSVRFSN